MARDDLVGIKLLRLTSASGILTSCTKTICVFRKRVVYVEGWPRCLSDAKYSPGPKPTGIQSAWLYSPGWPSCTSPSAYWHKPGGGETQLYWAAPSVRLP